MSKFKLILSKKGIFTRNGLPVKMLLIIALWTGAAACNKKQSQTPQQQVEHSLEVDKKQASASQQSVELSFVIDRSGSAGSQATLFDSTEQIMRMIQAAIALDREGLTSRGCKVRITIIGTSIRPRVYTAVLPPGKSWLKTNKKLRINRINQFRMQVLAALNEVWKAPANQLNSQVYLTLCQELNALSSSTFGETKALYIISDGIQSDGSIEFFKYADDLEKFKAAFPQFKEQMMQQCSLPDLSNIQITMSNSPNHVLGNFILVCDEFWRELIKQHNGNLIIKSSISS